MTQPTEGKTKIIEPGDKPGEVIIRSKDDITAGDGLKREQMEGKAVLSTTTTCNVFELLARHGIPTHYRGQRFSTSFVARQCVMLPLELIARRRATGSYRKRYPHSREGMRFEDPLIEFFEKDDKLSPPEAGDDTMNDPFLMFDFTGGRLLRYKPKQPISAGLIDTRMLSDTPFSFMTPTVHAGLADLTRQVFEVLEKAWAKLGGELIDFKIEVGRDISTGFLIVADVIDNDSWRLRFHGDEVSKESFRDGSKPMATIKMDYARVAELSGRLLD